MSHTKMIIPSFIVSELCPFENRKKKKSCMRHNSVTVIYIFMKLERNVYRIEMCCIYLWLHIFMVTFRFPFQNYGPLFVFNAYFV